MSHDSMHYGISRQALRVIGGTRVMCDGTAVCKFVEDLFQISGGARRVFFGFDDDDFCQTPNFFVN